MAVEGGSQGKRCRQGCHAAWEEPAPPRGLWDTPPRWDPPPSPSHTALTLVTLPSDTYSTQGDPD